MPAPAAVTVHGRTREARYRHPADWDAIAEVAAARARARRRQRRPALRARNRGPARVQRLRRRDGGARRAHQALDLPRSRAGSLGHHRRGTRRDLPPLCGRSGSTHWGGDEHGRTRLREFLRWHAGFWCRYAPQRPDGTWPSMQQRESSFAARSPLEALLARSDDAALDYVTDELMKAGDLSHAPPPAAAAPERDLVEAG